MRRVVIDITDRNQTVRRATNIDDAALWSTEFDPLLGSAVAHTTVLGQGTETRDFFSVTLDAGATITLDIDFPRSFGEQIWWPAGAIIVEPNGDYVRGGYYGGSGLESTFPFERALSFTADVAGTYVIKMGTDYSRENIIDPIPGGFSYILNISVTGHAATAPVVTSGGLLDGGDVLVGSAARTISRAGTATTCSTAARATICSTAAPATIS